MKSVYEITVFPLICTLSLYLISNLLGQVLIRGQRTCFKVREIDKTLYFVFVLFNNENETQDETQNLHIKKKKRKKKRK